MNTPLPKFSIALLLITAVISFTGTDAKAQSNVFRTLFHGGTYENAAERQLLYASNAKRPLGGLFAPGFTRTLTVLGGANFPSAGVRDLFEDDFAYPITGTSLLTPLPRSLDDTGYALSFAFGRRHNRQLRSEIEVAVRGNDVNQLLPSSLPSMGSDFSEESDGSVNVTSLMKNFIIDFDNRSLFTPYVGVGIGLSYIDVEYGEATGVGGAATFEEGASAFSYQAIGGVATKLNSFADFVIEYRFLGTSEVEVNGFGDDVSYNSSTLFMGATFEY